MYKAASYACMRMRPIGTDEYCVVCLCSLLVTTVSHAPLQKQLNRIKSGPVPHEKTRFLGQDRQTDGSQHYLIPLWVGKK